MTFKPEALDPKTWPAVFALLKPAIELGDDVTAEELIDDLLANRAQLWVNRKGGDPIAAAVTQRLGSLVHFQLLGGSDMKSWLDDLIAGVAERAKPLGIDRFTMTGRPGFEPVLKDKGWRRRAVIMECSL
jgi:hypothetical protein